MRAHPFPREGIPQECLICGEREWRIAQNPQASAEEVQFLCRTYPLTALAHPNCPIDLWWILARMHPVEATLSPLYPLVLLESPEKWEQLEKNFARRARKAYLEWPDPTLAQRLWVLDCVARVFPLLERLGVKTHDARHVTRVKREWALQGKDLAKHPSWEQTVQPSWDFLRREEDKRFKEESDEAILRYSLLSNALHAVLQSRLLDNIRRAAQTYGSMASFQKYQREGHVGQTLFENEYDEATAEEELWQWRRLLDYSKSDPLLPFGAAL